MSESREQIAYKRTERELNELIERCDRMLDGMSTREALGSTDTHQFHTARNAACRGLLALYNGDLFGALDSAYMAQRIVRVAESAMALPYVETAARVRRPFSDANENRQRQSKEQSEYWQSEAERLWSNPRHANKSKSDIARLIDSDNWNTIRRKITKP